MDPRTAAHALAQIAEFLELNGGDRYRSRAYRTAARAVLSVPGDDIRPLVRSGELERLKGIGPATMGVLRELAETGSSSYLERLSENAPEGLLDLMRVPGLGLSKIRQLHDSLGIASVQELEDAAADGRLAQVKGFGPRTAERIARGIAHLRTTADAVLFPHAMAEASRLLAAVGAHPQVRRAELAGSLRRRVEVAHDVDIVAECDGDPAVVAAAFARAPGVRQADTPGAGQARITFVDGARLDLFCATPERFAAALWRATGSAEHLADVAARLASRGLVVDGDAVRDGNGRPVALPDEAALYAAAGLAWVAPELREGRSEVAAAAEGRLPDLVDLGAIRGVLHCHSKWSDGTATIAEMAAAAGARGWSYIGITDHSESAFYAGGLSRDQVLRQHEEIDRLNAEGPGPRVLKGIEADILADGRVDYDAALLDRFDFVIASVHSRFGMDGAAMTERVLRALDDPHLTILGHPTGRLLLTREAYALDMQAVLEKAAETGAAVELNADPHRLDMDWRYCRLAKELGVAVEIGPDAHSARGLDYMEIGIGVARKGWLEAGDVLNARDARGVVEFAARRRAGSAARTVRAN
ncbi:MAG TPA: helix-hairpin-helix domain-containing protein [Gemmatimonadaceae bacterium]|nr:helix-hairpin-helix domain-containing protein [Gemmatimonadaceae bacterium]